jgi:hypothetical protein
VPAHIHPSPFRFAYVPVSFRGAAHPGSVSRCLLSFRNHRVPRAPLPLPGVTCSGGTSCPIRGRYPSFFALTDSCARPPSSYLLGSRLVWQVFAGCRQSLLDGGPSRRYLCKSFLGCLAPYLGVSSGASARFFPEDFGLPHAMTGSAFSQLPVQRLPHGAISRGCRHSFMFRPPSLLATQVAPTDTILPYGRRGVYFRTSVSSLPPSPSDMLTVRIGQLTAGDFHPIRLTALSAVPIAHSVNRSTLLKEHSI